MLICYAKYVGILLHFAPSTRGPFFFRTPFMYLFVFLETYLEIRHWIELFIQYMRVLLTAFFKFPGPAIIVEPVIFISLFFYLGMNVFFLVPVSYTHLTLPTIYSV